MDTVHTETEHSELHIPILIPSQRQIILRENVRLFTVSDEERNGVGANTYVQDMLSKKGFRSVQPLGQIEPIDGVHGMAFYHEVGAHPIDRIPGATDPRQRLALFSMNHLARERKRFDELDLEFIEQAVKLLHKHDGRIL